MRLAGCDRLNLSPLTGHWFRALNLKHWKSRTKTAHSVFLRSRFSAATQTSPGPRLLYLGENHQVAIYEVGALLGDPNSPISNPTGSWMLMNLRIKLHHIADLSDRDEQRLLGTNPQELTGVWTNSKGSAPTQKLGAALFDIPRLEGFIFPSARSGSRSLAVFMDKLDAKSRITFDNESNGASKCEDFI